MNAFTLPIPTYQCHKRVQALKIAAIIDNPRGVELHFENKSFVPMQVGVEWAVKHDPHPGGYIVWYEDGYVSYSPAAAFEAGYTLVETADGAVRSPDWPKLDKPAMVGVGRFGVGVSTRLVVEAAQRRYADNVTPEKDAERIARAQDAVAKARAMLAETDAARVLAAAMEMLRRVPDEFAPPDHPIWAQAREIIGDDDGPGEEDGPWAEGWEDRIGSVGPATLSVKVGKMVESNGRVTWSVLLAKSPDAAPWDRHQVYSDAIEGRARYEAAVLAHFLGLGPEPDILEFDTDPPAEEVRPVSPTPDWSAWPGGPSEVEAALASRDAEIDRLLSRLTSLQITARNAFQEWNKSGDVFGAMHRLYEQAGGIINLDEPPKLTIGPATQAAREEGK